MYDLLRRFLPAHVAGLALVLWYVALILLCVLCAHGPQVAFRYAEL